MDSINDYPHYYFDFNKPHRYYRVDNDPFCITFIKFGEGAYIRTSVEYFTEEELRKKGAFKEITAAELALII